MVLLHLYMYIIIVLICTFTTKARLEGRTGGGSETGLSLDLKGGSEYNGTTYDLKCRCAHFGAQKYTQKYHIC